MFLLYFQLSEICKKDNSNIFPIYTSLKINKWISEKSFPFAKLIEMERGLDIQFDSITSRQ